MGPDIYSRVMCAKEPGVARRSSLFASMIVIPLSFLLVFFGLLASAKFPGIPAEAALPKTVSVLIPIGLKGLIVAGFLGAIMSSADTCLISASTILTLNVVRPIYRGEDEKHLKITRGTVVLLGAVAWFIAGQQKGIISSLLLGYTVFVGGVVMPTLATFFRKGLRVTPRGALWAIIVGGGTAMLGKIQGGVILKNVISSHGQAFLELALGPYYLSILPVVLSVLVMLCVSRFR